MLILILRTFLSLKWSEINMVLRSLIFVSNCIELNPAINNPSLYLRTLWVRNQRFILKYAVKQELLVYII